MTNYTKSVDFAIKDTMQITNPLKVVRGEEIDDEFNAISQAISSKADTAGPTFTGTSNFSNINTVSFSLNGVPISADGSEINTLSGLTASTTELNTLVGVTSSIQTQIDAKLASAGGSVTGNITLDDNVVLRFGTGNDLVAYHDGSNSYITEQGTGSLFVKSNGDGIVFRDAGNANYISLLQSSGEAKLFHINAGSATQRLATSATGVTVNGETATDTVKLGLWNIKVDTNELVFEYNGTEVFKLGTNGAVTSANNITAFGTI